MSKNISATLQELANAYFNKITLNAELILQFDFLPDAGSWSLVLSPGRDIHIQEGTRSDARFIFLLSPEVLFQLINGDLSPLTAAGRAHISEPAPLDFRLGEGLTMTPDIYLELIEFTQRFFNPSNPERVLLGVDHSRLVHGGHAVALFYEKGFRSAWYSLGKGEQLNEPGDTNPFPQALIFISGQGRAKIGEDTFRVTPNVAYLIPPNTEHIVWNDDEEPLALIFLAWGEGA